MLATNTLSISELNILKKANMDIVKYCLEHMCSKTLIHRLYDDFNIEYRSSDSYKKLVERLKTGDFERMNPQVITSFFRKNWNPSPVELHLKNLKSGVLNGHNWHGAMPSMLHLSLQNKVRDHIDGKIDLEQLIQIGADIMKHEYFMVGVHDICETAIIQNFPNTIPPIGSKSISDFIFDGIPYDLKITNYFDGLSKEYVNNNKEEIAKKLLAGADILRLRAQAQKTINNWGLNRFYLLVENQERWLSNPEEVLKEFIEEVKNLTMPIPIKIEEIVIQTQLIAI